MHWPDAAKPFVLPILVVFDLALALGTPIYHARNDHCFSLKVLFVLEVIFFGLASLDGLSYLIWLFGPLWV